MKFKILGTDDVSFSSLEGRKLLEKNGCEIVNMPCLRWMSAEERARFDYAGLLQDIDAVIAGGEPWDSELIHKAGKVKIIARVGAAAENVDIQEAARRGIWVSNTPGANALSVAEMTIGLMLALSRELVTSNNETKNGIWKRHVGTELKGKTLGIIGFGRIGVEVGRIANFLGMDLLAYDICWNEDNAKGLNVVKADFDELLKRSDFITIHIPLTEDTKELITRRQLEMMKRTAYLVNMSRGGIVNENDLADILGERKIAGAAIDVFTREPAEPDNPLLKLENIIATPHMGACTEEAFSNMSLTAIKDVISVLYGGKPLYPLNYIK